MSRKYSTCLLVVVVLAITSSLLAAQDFDPKRFYQGMKDWRDTFGDYSCLMRVEFLNERPEYRNGSDCWLVCSHSKKLGILRVDRKKIGDFNEDGFSTNYEIPVTTFTSRDFVIQIQGESLAKLDLTKELKQKDLALFMDHPRLDPLLVPVLGWGSFNDEKVAPVPMNPILRLIDEGKLVGEPVEDGRATQFKMSSFPKAKLYDTVTVDKKWGNLPVALVRADESGNRVLEKIHTTWAVHKGTYLPKSVNILMYQRVREGGVVPGRSWTAKFYWVFDAIPPSVFSNDSGGYMGPTQLIEFVLDNQVQASELK